MDLRDQQAVDNSLDNPKPQKWFWLGSTHIGRLYLLDEPVLLDGILFDENDKDWLFRKFCYLWMEIIDLQFA